MFVSCAILLVVRWCLAAVLLVALALPARADIIKVAITVDNSYALFYGTHNQATNFVGSNFTWQDVETYNFNLPASNYLYVVTASDLSVAQGFLGQFENLTSGFKFYSSDPQWQVMATGLGPNAPYTGSAANLALLTQEIQDANAGGNPSHGWMGLTQGAWAFTPCSPGSTLPHTGSGIAQMATLIPRRLGSITTSGSCSASHSQRRPAIRFRIRGCLRRRSRDRSA
jgi:hypothetical protein